MVDPSPAVDPDHDLIVEDLEEAIYAYLAQADLALEAIDANTTVEQLATAKEAEKRTEAESAAAEAAKSKSEQVTAPTEKAQPSDTPTAPSGAAGTPAGGVKWSSRSASAPSSNRLQRKPVILGTRDG